MTYDGVLVLEATGELEFPASFISPEQPLLTGGQIFKITEKGKSSNPTT